MVSNYSIEQAEKMLVQLDDSNVVSSYKNEDAARVIRMLLSDLRAAERILDEKSDAVAAERKRIAESPVFMLERRSAYADDRGRYSWEIQEDRGFWLNREDAERILVDVNDNAYGDEWDIIEIDPGQVRNS